MMLLIFLALAAGPSDGKTAALDDWHAMTILQVAGSPGGSEQTLRVAAGDLDGDGLDDDAFVKIECADGAVRQAHYVVAPRDSASGMATGKRMHKPFLVTKDWGAASPQLMAMKPTYDVKAMKGARVAAAADGWQAMTLGATTGLCPAAAAAAAAVVKSKSNITNN